MGHTFVSCCGNGMAFSQGNALYHSNEDDLHSLDQATARATVVARMVFSPPPDDDLRVNGMDYQSGTGILFGSLNDWFGGQPENYLVTINTTTEVVTIIGRTVNGLDALAFAP